MTTATETATPTRSFWATLRLLWPSVAPYWRRIALAFLLLALGKIATVSSALALKWLVDHLGSTPPPLVVPLALLAGYGAVRLGSTLFQELRTVVFARVMARSARQVALRVFEHLHELSLRFHLDRRTGAVSRDLERGMSAIADLLDWSIYTILPTVFEITLVATILVVRYDWTFAAITLGTIAVYAVFTFLVTDWRLRHYRDAIEADTKASSRAVDALLNYETVKYFGNERYEAARYDQSLVALERATVKSLKSLAALNVGQSAIVVIGLALLLWRAAAGVVEARMTLGDLVLVNAFLLQLAMPLNFLGMVYREVKQAVTNIERHYALLDQVREVADRPGAIDLPPGTGRVSFERVSFGYDPRRDVLHEVSFEVPAGATVAVVGQTGSGKSTLARLLFRFFDVSSGAVRIDGHDRRDLRQASLRRAIGIVPQDTVLFNDTIYHNIAYGRPEAAADEVYSAAAAANIHQAILAMPDGYQTAVGERGLKLSGGEKQRVAIARTILKNPRILVLDEATSALDTGTERRIQGELMEIARRRTTLVIAHRLSTVVDADQILGLDHGHVVERGSHDELLALGGRYAHIWRLQLETFEAGPVEA